MILQKQSLRLAALGCITMLAACTGGQSGILPIYTSDNIAAKSKLQFAVGTANYAGTPALNTVVTFRQANGLSATLLNSPTIVGPAGFTVPTVSTAGVDGGTASLSSTPQVIPGTLSTVPRTTFNQSGGVFGYGFAPLNSTTGGGQVAGITTATGYYSEPFFVPGSAKFAPLLGPPATPNFNDGNTAGGFPGYPSGFTSFAGVTLVPGGYTLSVLVPTADPKLAPNIAPVTAQLTSTSLLPTFAAPTFVSDGNGGGTVTMVVPLGVTETIVYVQDSSAGLNYSFVVQGTGPQTVVVGDKLGPVTTAGVIKPTLGSGDAINVIAVGFDYPAFEAAPPANVSQTPTIVGANGQADLTASPITAGTE